MTADERIEALLNRADQTISDLPKANGDLFAYGFGNMQSVLRAVGQW